MVCVLTERELKAAQRLAQRLEKKGMIWEGRALRRIVHTSTTRREVKASEAARTLHVTPQTVRNWVKRGIVAGRIDETGHVFVDFAALKPVLELDAALPSLRDDEPDVDMDTILQEIDEYRAEKCRDQTPEGE